MSILNNRLAPAMSEHNKILLSVFLSKGKDNIDFFFNHKEKMKLNFGVLLLLRMKNKSFYSDMDKDFV